MTNVAECTNVNRKDLKNKKLLEIWSTHHRVPSKLALALIILCTAKGAHA